MFPPHAQPKVFHNIRQKSHNHMSENEDHFIAEIHVDGDSLPVLSAETQHERRIAIFDLLEENCFRPHESPSGPYILHISLKEGERLYIDIDRTNGTSRGQVTLSLQSYRRLIKDYFIICESYHNAIRTATSAQIEAIDMGRRGLHNEGARQIIDNFSHFAEIDFDTARRFFVLLYALHRRTDMGARFD